MFVSGLDRGGAEQQGSPGLARSNPPFPPYLCPCMRVCMCVCASSQGLKDLWGSSSRTRAKPPSNGALGQAEPVQIRLAHKCERVEWPEVQCGEPQCLLGEVNRAVVCGLRRQVAVQTSPAMPCYLRARRAGSSACQADTRPGLKALEQKRKRSAMGRVRRQNMEPQTRDGEEDLLGARLPWAERGYNGKADMALMMGKCLGQSNKPCSERGRSSHSEARAPQKSSLLPFGHFKWEQSASKSKDRAQD